MVARGDLGAELPVEEVPYWQSKIVQGCRRRGKPVIGERDSLWLRAAAAKCSCRMPAELPCKLMCACHRA